MLHSLYEKENSFVMSYKYRHAEVHVCQNLDLRKIQLQLLLISMARAIPIIYLQGHGITENKKKYFLSFLDYTPRPPRRTISIKN